MNDPDSSSADYTFKNSLNRVNQLAGAEAQQERLLSMIRYCKTMKEILVYLGVLDSKEDDKLDHFLLEIADNAEKGE